MTPQTRGGTLLPQGCSSSTRLLLQPERRNRSPRFSPATAGGTGDRAGCPSLVAPRPVPTVCPRGSCPQPSQGPGAAAAPLKSGLPPAMGSVAAPQDPARGAPLIPLPLARAPHPPQARPRSIRSRKHLFPVRGAAWGGSRKKTPVPAGYLHPAASGASLTPSTSPHAPKALLQPCAHPIPILIPSCPCPCPIPILVLIPPPTHHISCHLTSYLISSPPLPCPHPPPHSDLISHPSSHPILSSPPFLSSRPIPS